MRGNRAGKAMEEGIAFPSARTRGPSNAFVTSVVGLTAAALPQRTAATEATAFLSASSLAVWRRVRVADGMSASPSAASSSPSLPTPPSRGARATSRAAAPRRGRHAAISAEAEAALQTYSGLFVVDKPLEWTSFDVVNRTRSNIHRHLRLQGVNIRTKDIKVGHGGTLDPNATGALVIGVGRQPCKMLHMMLRGTKRYVATALLGVETDTQDCAGVETTRRAYEHVTAEFLESVIREHFVGEITQTPPVYSALRVNGQRAYELARKGEAPELSARQVMINTNRVLWFRSPEFGLETMCSHGTYIRSMVQDIGRALGSAAVVSALRREEQGVFSLKNALSVDDLKNIDNIRQALAELGRENEQLLEEYQSRSSET